MADGGERGEGLACGRGVAVGVEAQQDIAADQPRAAPARLRSDSDLPGRAIHHGRMKLETEGVSTVAASLLDQVAARQVGERFADHLAVESGDDVDAPTRLVGVERPALDLAGPHAVDEAFDGLAADHALSQAAGIAPERPQLARHRGRAADGAFILRG